MRALVKVQGPGHAWRTAYINHRHRVRLHEGEWLEIFSYEVGGPVKLVDDDGLPVWFAPQPAPHVTRFDPWAMTRGFRMRRLA